MLSLKAIVVGEPSWPHSGPPNVPIDGREGVAVGGPKLVHPLGEVIRAHALQGRPENRLLTLLNVLQGRRALPRVIDALFGRGRVARCGGVFAGRGSVGVGVPRSHPRGRTLHCLVSSDSRAFLAKDGRGRGVPQWVPQEVLHGSQAAQAHHADIISGVLPVAL